MRRRYFFWYLGPSLVTKSCHDASCEGLILHVSLLHVFTIILFFDCVYVPGLKVSQISSIILKLKTSFEWVWSMQYSFLRRPHSLSASVLSAISLFGLHGCFLLLYSSDLTFSFLLKGPKNLFHLHQSMLFYEISKRPPPCPRGLIWKGINPLKRNHPIQNDQNCKSDQYQISRWQGHVLQVSASVSVSLLQDFLLLLPALLNGLLVHPHHHLLNFQLRHFPLPSGLLMILKNIRKVHVSIRCWAEQFIYLQLSPSSSSVALAFSATSSSSPHGFS